MQADPTAQHRLLDLARIDAELVKLRHQATHIPENEQLSALQTQRLALSEKVTEAETRVSDAQAEVRRSEADMVPVKDRLERNQKRIDAGEIIGERALASVQDEIDHLKGRISDLEDAALEAMDQAEQAQKEQDEFTSQRTEIENKMRELLAIRDEKKTKLAHQIDDSTRERGLVVEPLPADLVTVYDKVAARTGNTGAAELRAKRCTGCGLEIDATGLHEFAAAAPNEVLRCESCDRILIRTGQSGL